MNKSYKIKVLFVFITILFISCSEKNENITKQSNETPNDFLFSQRAYPYGKIESSAYKKALEWKHTQNKNKSVESLVWEFSGPMNIGGRITDIEIPIDDENTYYIAAASGGIFKTNDAGESWNPIFDEQAMLAIGDISISDNDTNLMFVGTGEVNAGGGSLAYDGDGVYKSINAGASWENKGLEDVGSISKILIDPSDNETIYVGTMGKLFKNDTERGVFRSQDGGDSWEKVFYVSDSTGIIDMAINRIDPNIVYAASWERIRRPNYRRYGGETSGLYRTTDGGNTWTELNNGLPSSTTEKGRISISISQSNPDILYASYTDLTGYLQDIYKTTDGGDSWSNLSISGITNTSYHWWFGGLYVDPQNPDIVYYAGFNVAKSTNGGLSWSNLSSSIHVDQHCVAFNAQNSNIVLLGNDGGLYKSTNSGNNFAPTNNLPITQFYHYVVDEQNSDKQYGGAQDNNTIRTTTGSLNDWSPIYGGDGFQPLVDPNNTNTIYAMYQRGNLARSLNNASSFSTILSGINASDRNNWDTPICLDPNDSDILYYGTHRVYKSINRGSTWSPISPDLTNGPYTGNLSFGTLTSIDVSMINSSVIYAGSDDSNVWVSDDSGESWLNISEALPNYWVTKVKASKQDENTVFATFSGYRYGETSGHVFMSENKGISWVDISSDLPDIPVNDIEIDDFGNLFIASDVGVFVSSNLGESWDVLGSNLPSVVVTDLYYHAASAYLYAATYGRSSYKIDLSENVEVSELSTEFVFDIFPNPAKDYLTIQTSNKANLVEVYNTNGQLVEKYYPKEKMLRIDVKEYLSGVYYVKVSANENSITHKLIID